MKSNSGVASNSSRGLADWMHGASLPGPVPALTEVAQGLLALALSAAPTETVLTELVRAAQHLCKRPTKGAIFIADLEQACLRFAAAAGLPESYTGVVDRFPIGPGSPSCGKAAFTGQAVIVGDVAKDALWAPFLQLAQEHAIRACWSFPLHTAEGILLGTFAVYHDRPAEPDEREFADARYLANIASLVIERHKRVEQQLAAQVHAENLLKEEGLRKDGFLAMLGHELRNPLAALSNSVQAMRSRPEAAGLALGIMERQTRHMTRLVEDLLDASRISQGKLSLKKTRLQLRPVIEQAVEALSGVCIASRQRLLSSYPQEGVELHGDPERLIQLFSNLLHNASKFSPEGGTIRIEARRESESAYIHIRDSGIGIAPEDIHRIFLMFVQVADAEGRHGGLGVGLALVQEIAGLHGGDVRVSSPGTGQGTEFIVRLPLAGEGTNAGQ